MGVQGLRKLVESSGCARQLNTAPPGEVAQSAAAAPAVRRQQAEQEAQQAQEAQAAGGQEQQQPLVTADHVLCDMNCIIHQTFSRNHPDAQTTIRCVLQALRHLFTVIVRARRTLILAFDGPAPVAKLATQRQRRRKVAHLDVANSNNFSDLSITTGSTFMLELEQHVTHFINNNATSPLFGRTANVSVSGSSVPGEGEAKIAAALSRIAATSAKSENDSVVVVGNDIDLVLTCISATTFHNIGVLNPQTMQIIDVGSFFARWVSMESSSGKAIAAAEHEQAQKKKKKDGDEDDGADDDEQGTTLSMGEGIGFVSFANLPGARVDFVWLFMLNGGDYYDGLGDVALSLWKRYKMLKRERPEFRLVSKNHQLIVNSLRALFQCEQIGVLSEAQKRRRRKRGGDVDEDSFDDSDFDDEKPGHNIARSRRDGDQLTPEQKKAAVGLLHASLWSLIGTVSGYCPNFRFRPVDPKHTADTTYVSSATIRSTVATLESETIMFKIPVKVAPTNDEDAPSSSKKNKKNKNKKKQLDDDEEAPAGDVEDMNDESFDFDGDDDGQQQQQQKKKLYSIQMQAHSLTALSLQPSAATFIHPDDPNAPLTPLQTFCALMPRLELLPKPVQAIFEKNATLAQKWHAGGTELLGAMRRVFQLVDMEALSPAERFLTQFGDPVDVKGGFFRGHPLQGVARKDHGGNRKYSIDFFRFTYAGAAAAAASAAAVLGHHHHNNNNTTLSDGSSGPVAPSSSSASSGGQHRSTATTTSGAPPPAMLVPVVADDLVPGAARINQKAKQLQRLSKEQAREATENTKKQLRNIETNLKRQRRKGGDVAKSEGKRSSLLKKQSSQQGNTQQGKRLYWHDVFSKESKEKVARH